MNKILFVADFHGNMPATLALENEINRIQPDQIWFLGDAVGKGPESDKTCDWVRKNCQFHIAGNWDYDFVQSYLHPETNVFDNKFYLDQLGSERLNWLSSLPLESEILISGINFRLLHGRPTDKNYTSVLTLDELSSGFTNKEGKIFGGFISADCHMPYIREMHQGYAINTGSIGNSLGITRAHCVLLEGELNSTALKPITMSVISIPYDNKLAAKIASETPDLPNSTAYQKEVLTGIYSR